MLAYAANRTTVASRRSSPNLMLIVIGAHVAGVALLMTARMDLPIAPPFQRTIVDLIRIPPEPPEHVVTPRVTQPRPAEPTVDRPPVHVPVPQNTDLDLGTHPFPPVDPGTIADGGATVTTSVLPTLPHLDPVKTGPRLLTPQSELKPPYPASKLINEEEGVVTIKLTIDENGRVVAVDPVGRADPAFLDAARRHLIAHWRFKPATEDGRAVAFSEVITLTFKLDS